MVKVYDIFGKYISQTELAMPDDNRTIDETINIIQNRVQLMLDEK